jgi:hypothetical protein
MNLLSPCDEVKVLKQLFHDSLFKANGEVTKRIAIKRTKKLIAPLVYENSKGVLNNSHWAYKVPFAFCPALDIELQKLQKTTDKIVYYYCAWTQGCALSFSAGHFFESANNGIDIQIISANPVTFDLENRKMNDGQIVYQLFKKRGLGEFKTVTQFEFLELLIYGLGNNND